MNLFLRILVILLILFLVSCSHIPPSEDEWKVCVQDQLDLYGDLCAESSSGYEDMNGDDAHYEGVRCAVEGIFYCTGK